MSDIVNHLYGLSIIIRSSASPRDLLRKASTIDLSHFLAWDTEHVRQKFPEANPKLVERLGKANTRRRQVFRYLQNHHAIFSKHETRGSQEWQHFRGNDTSSDHEDKSMHTPKRLAEGIGGSSAFVSTARATENTQTTVETFVEASPEVLVDDAPSEITSATSGGSELEGSLHLPELPPNALDRKAFECPFCFEIMKVSSASSWR